MFKSILSGSFGFNEAEAALVPMHRRGVDSSWLVKRAASHLFDFSKYASDDKETLIHLLALGDGETTGANRNGDYFSRNVNQTRHNTFLKAGYFHNHENKDKSKALGRVVASAHNGPMGRVELIVALDNNKCAKDLAELEKNGSFPVSMSCLVSHDICSICDNKAKTRKDYCKHASDMLGSILDDGRQVYVANPDPDFFDISKVWRPADRVAYTIRRLDKAASAGKVISGAELAETFAISAALYPTPISSVVYLKAPVMEKISKALDLAGYCSALHGLDATDNELEMLKACDDKDSLFDRLHKAGICLSLGDFVEIAGLGKKADVKTSAIRKKIVAYLKNKDSKVMNNGSYDGKSKDIPTPKLASAIDSLAARCSLYRVDLGKAIVTPAPVQQVVKSASALDEYKADSVAAEYAAYLVSFATSASRTNNSRSEFVQNLTSLRALA